jgi:hypothetical protein
LVTYEIPVTEIPDRIFLNETLIKLVIEHSGLLNEERAYEERVQHEENLYDRQFF